MRPLVEKIAPFALSIYFVVGALAQFSSDTRLVVLHVSVVDKKDKLVTALNQRAFKVFENNAAQQIKIFHREDIPVSLGIVIDNSGSMRLNRPTVEAAALSLVRESNSEDEVFIVNFNDEAFLDVPFTNSIQKMKEGLARIDSSGGTAMRDAVKMSIDYTKVKATKDKKVILLITDGNDNSSSTSLDQVIKQASQANVIVYTIGLFKGEDRHEAAHARQALKELTSATGGLVFFPQDVGEVQQLAAEIARDIRLQYTIAYSPTIQALDGSYRKIYVSVNAAGSPVVRTRSGYYAVPDTPKANPQSETSKSGPSLPQ